MYTQTAYRDFTHTSDQPLDDNISLKIYLAGSTQMRATVHRLKCTPWPEPLPAIQPKQLIDQ